MRLESWSERARGWGGEKERGRVWWTELEKRGVKKGAEGGEGRKRGERGRRVIDLRGSSKERQLACACKSVDKRGDSCGLQSGRPAPNRSNGV